MAWEMVGYGDCWQAGNERDISVAAQADYLLEWMSAAGIERAVMVGHDLGGGVAQIAAVRQPQRCAGLVLTNSIGYDSWPIPAVKALRAMGGLVEKAPLALFRRQLALFLRMGHDSGERASESFEQHWSGYDHSEGPATFIRQARSLRTEDTLAVADRLSNLRVPAAIAWGAADRFQKIEYGRRFARDLNAPLDAVADAKHFLPENRPDAVAGAIRHVLAEVSAAKRQTV